MQQPHKIPISHHKAVGVPQVRTSVRTWVSEMGEALPCFRLWQNQCPHQKIERRFLIALYATLICLLGQAAGQTMKPPPAFPYEKGWLGADAAYSIPLNTGQSLWLFGDTFVGGRAATTRAQRTGMPRNSIGISQCDNQHCLIRYYWNRMYQPHPRAFFDLAGADWFWPLDGFTANGSLYIVLEKMRTVGTGAFGFGNSALVLATIPNFQAPPSQWKIHYQKILSGDLAVPGVSVVAGHSNFNPYPKDPNGSAWVYLFTLRKIANRSVIALTRLPIASLSHAAQANGEWQYLSTNNQWLPWTTAGTLPANAKTLLNEGYTEFTVRYHPEQARWVAVAPSTHLAEGRAIYSLATNLDGPWSTPQTLLQYPEMKKGNPGNTPNVICYAAKEHPEFETSASLLVTYACNSVVEEEVFRNMDLYHPVVVARPAPKP
jgi:hypothetical protein